MRLITHCSRSTHILALAIVFSLLAPSNVLAQKYSITNLGTLSNLGLGEDNSGASAINAYGQIVGYSTTADGNTHAFLWQNGIMADLGTLSGISSWGSSINDIGQVVGWSQLPGGSIVDDTATFQAFIWTNGVMSGLGTLGGATSKATGINNAGMVVGYSETPSGLVGPPDTDAFVWKNGVITEIGSAPQDFSASGVNAAGQVVGGYYPNINTVHAFLWQNGGLTDLGDLGGGYSGANAINDVGQVVGVSTLANTDIDVFLWQNDVMTDLGIQGTAFAVNNAGQVVGAGYINLDANWPVAYVWQNGVATDLNQLIPAGTGMQLESANGINDSGQIVGTATYLSTTRGFLLTPNPFANRQTVVVAHNTATAITLTAQDTEMPPPTLTFAIKTEPIHGTLSAMNASTGAVTYTPNNKYLGADVFTFTVSNGTDTSAPATVTLNVAAGIPTANAQTVAIAHNVAKSITVTGTDPDNPILPLTFALKSEPAHGKVSGFNSTTGVVTYTPGNNKSGQDSFTFTVNNGVNTSAPATVTLNVGPGMPAAKAQTVSVAHNTERLITLTGTDPDNPPLPLTFAIKTRPAHGTVSGLNATTGVVTYTPGANKYGADNFTFMVSNGTSTSAPATVNLNVAPGVPTAMAQSVAVEHNTSTQIFLKGTDPDSPALPLTFAIATQPADGKLSEFTAATGYCIYTPSANYHGADSFTFTVSNGTNKSAPAAVTLDVATGVPAAGAWLLNVMENKPISVTLTGSDPDNPALVLTYAIAAPPAHGTLGTLNTTTGKVTYTPNANFQGIDSFMYTVSNGTNKSTPGKVTLNVSGGG